MLTLSGSYGYPYGELNLSGFKTVVALYKLRVFS